MRFLNIIRIIIHYRIDALILSTPKLKRFKWLLYIRPWHYLPSKKLTRGERIRKALEELGPIFIKFGQTLSTRRDLLPHDIGDELIKLQDACRPFDAQLAKVLIETALEDSVDNLFKSFEIEPLASASIAQVHAAVTHNNEKVAVKVLRPNVDKIIARDIRWMFTLARWIDKHPISEKLRPVEIVTEFESIITAELDLRLEADNCEKIGQNFAHNNLLYIPKLHRDLCAKTVLTTERIYGIPVGDIAQLEANNINMQRLAEEGVIIFFTQVFKHNFFHADMHPGNIFVSKTGQYMGVDFGIMGSLTEADKDFLADIFLAFFNQDYRGVASAYIDSGWASASTDVGKFTQAIEKICAPMFAKSLGDISFGQVLMDMMQAAKDFDISVQPQLLLLDKTLLNVEGLGRQLYDKLDLWATAKPFLEDLMQEKHTIKNTLKKLKQQAPILLKALPELPELTLGALKQLNQLKCLNAQQAQQNNAILKQLKNNAKIQNNAIFAGSLIIFSGILITQSLWIGASVCGVLAVWFWLKT
jgi:ubiquinone biosynthesis protein